MAIFDQKKSLQQRLLYPQSNNPLSFVQLYIWVYVTRDDTSERAVTSKVGVEVAKLDFAATC